LHLVFLQLETPLSNVNAQPDLDRARGPDKNAGVCPGRCAGQHIFVLIFLVTFFIKEKSDKKNVMSLEVFRLTEV
jgi:hypothetical protein